MKTVSEVVEQLQANQLTEAAKVVQGFNNTLLELGYSQRSNDCAVQQYLDPNFRR